VASALIAAAKGMVESPVAAETSGGETLNIFLRRLPRDFNGCFWKGYTRGLRGHDGGRGVQIVCSDGPQSTGIKREKGERSEDQEARGKEGAAVLESCGAAAEIPS